MNPEEEVLELLTQAASLPWGRAEAETVARAAVLAESAGLEEYAVQAHTKLLSSYTRSGQEALFLSAFVWCAERYKQRPDLFGTDELHLLGWYYKRALGVAIDFPSTPLAVIEQIYAEAVDFHRKQGESLRALHSRRYNLAKLCGDELGAVEAFNQWRVSEHSELTDCPGCDPETEVLWYLHQSDWESATRCGDAALEDEGTKCESQPESLLSLLLEPYLRTGRRAEAWAAHLRCYRRYQADPGEIMEVYKQLRYLALLGQSGEPHQFDRGLAILIRHLPQWASAGNPYALFSIAKDSAALLFAMQAAGRGGETVSATFPGASLPWFSDRDLPTPTISQAASYCAQLARRIARAFDERSGINAPGPVETHLEAYLAPEAVPGGAVVEEIPDISGLVPSPENPTEDPSDEPPLVAVALTGLHNSEDLREIVAAQAANSANTTISLTLRAQDLFHRQGTDWHPPHDLSPSERYYWLGAALNALLLQLRYPEAKEAAQLLEEAVMARGLALAQAEGDLVQLRVDVELYESAGTGLQEQASELAERVGAAIEQVPEELTSVRQLKLLRHASELLLPLERRQMVRELDQALTEHGGSFPAEEEAEALCQQAIIASIARNNLRACALADQAMRTPSADPLGIRLVALVSLSNSSAAAGFSNEAISYGRDLLNIASAAKLETTALLASGLLAGLLTDEKRYLEAAEVCESALLRTERIAASELILSLRARLAKALGNLGNHTGAAEHFLAVADWNSLCGQDEAAMYYYREAGQELAETSDSAGAAAAWARIVQLASQREDWQLTHQMLVRQACALTRGPTRRAAAASLPTAEELMQRAWDILQRHSEAFSSVNEAEAEWHDSYSHLLWILDLNEKAWLHAEEALQRWRDNPQCAVLPLLRQANILAEADRRTEARQHIERIRALRGLGSRHQAWEGLAALEEELDRRDAET